LGLAFATVPVLLAGLGAAVAWTADFFVVEIRLCAVAAWAVVLRAAAAPDRRAATFRAELGVIAAWGIAKRSPASGASDTIRFAAAIALGDAPYRLPIMARVSPLSTLCIRHEARRSAGTVSNASTNDTAVPRGTFS
jgi:hypothetical protein